MTTAEKIRQQIKLYKVPSLRDVVALLDEVRVKEKEHEQLKKELETLKQECKNLLKVISKSNP